CRRGRTHSCASPWSRCVLSPRCETCSPPGADLHRPAHAMNDGPADESARLPSGSGRLDTVLGGGLPRHGIILLIGQPGSGKTILAQQYVFHNATVEAPAVY